MFHLTKNGDQCKCCGEQRYRLENGEWAFYCVVCGSSVFQSMHATAHLQAITTLKVDIVKHNQSIRQKGLDSKRGEAIAELRTKTRFDGETCWKRVSKRLIRLNQ